MGAAVVERPRRERIDPFLSQAGQPVARDFPGRSTGVGGGVMTPPYERNGGCRMTAVGSGHIHHGMIATGDHFYFYSLRGQLPTAIVMA